jgi:pimeloyl-ACP methyl ester carboxylesterase
VETLAARQHSDRGAALLTIKRRADITRLLTVAACLFALAPLAVAQSPAPLGALVDVGGYRVHLYCAGDARPTVMIVGAGFSFDWALVQPAVAKFARVCTYDPAGFAWSGAGPGMGCADRVNEIHQLLKHAGVDGPYVLTGLSIGGLVARLYAARYPDDVAGMVIVDYAFLNPGSGIPTSTPTSRPDLDSPPVLISQTPIDLTVEDIAHFENLPPRARDLHRWAMSLHPALPTVETAEACTADVDAAAGNRAQPLGSMPLAVVSTVNGSPNYPKLQTMLLGLSRNSKQFMAEKSFHAVEIDQPDVVVQAIRETVDAVRSKRRLKK